jgi:hypothetical protein
MTHVLLTVGTNPLPILVSAHRLYQLYGEPPMTFLHSTETLGEAERVIEALARQLGFEGPPENWKLIKVEDATRPSSVGEAVSGEFLPNARGQQVHLNYTGGTKTMGLQAMKVLSEAVARGEIGAMTDSYLDPWSHRLLDGDGAHVDPAWTDERLAWRMSVEELAKLHGFATEFTWRGWAGRVEFGAGLERTKRTHPNPPAPPSEALLSIAEGMRAALSVRENGKKWADENRKNRWKSSRYWPNLPDPKAAPCTGFLWPGCPARVANGIPEWADLPVLMNQHFNRDVWVWNEVENAWQCNPVVLTSVQLEELNTLCSGGWLEIVVFASLKRQLESRGRPFDIVHSVRCARDGDSGQPRQFELDVVAAIGYQLLIVSCTASVLEKDIKQKGFEAVHRGRQIGGDGVKVLVIGLQDAAEATHSEGDIRLDIGGKHGDQLEVLPVDYLPDLDGHLHRYLNDLDWREE